ncbi:hypothetical protein GCM10023349_11220 [Nocardioides conyzicola]|uniref:Uncharacterized protein n=1 Tax=Nocardioides conyzicola TaxID=1651781 RepID=A0ABP8X1M2_9ACTN
MGVGDGRRGEQADGEGAAEGDPGARAAADAGKGGQGKRHNVVSFPRLRGELSGSGRKVPGRQKAASPQAAEAAEVVPPSLPVLDVLSSIGPSVRPGGPVP